MALLQQANRFLALPFMVWTILCTVAAGLFGVSLIFAFPSLKSAHRDGLLTDTEYDSVFITTLGPFVFVAVMFKLYIWWLVVVFRFYQQLRFAGQELRFDGVQMRTV